MKASSPQPDIPTVVEKPARPKSLVVRVVGTVVRLACVSFLLLAGLLLIQSFRAIFEPSAKLDSLIIPPTDPRDTTAVMPSVAAYGLEGAWSVYDGDWTVGWQATGQLPVTPLPNTAPTGSIGELEQTILEWLNTTGPPVRDGTTNLHLLHIGLTRIEARTQGDGATRRLCSFRVIMPSQAGAWSVLSCVPQSQRATMGEARQAPLLPLPTGGQTLARRQDKSGQTMAELVRCDSQSSSWRLLLRDADWMVEELPTGNGFTARKANQVLRAQGLTQQQAIIAEDWTLILVDPESPRAPTP